MPKMKTNRGAAKRFRVTKNKKFKYAKAGRRHMMECKSTAKSRSLRESSYLHAADDRHAHQLLPYA